MVRKSSEQDKDTKWHVPYEQMGGKTPFERLKELAEVDILSGGRIADVLTAEGFEVTRSAVGAKAARNNVQLRGGQSRSGSRSPRGPRKAVLVPRYGSTIPAPRMHIPKPLVVEEDPVVLEDGAFVSLMTVNDRMCRWPIGDPSESNFHFCGHKPKEGTPYCEAHARKAYQPQTEHRRDKDRMAS